MCCVYVLCVLSAQPSGTVLTERSAALFIVCIALIVFVPMPYALPQLLPPAAPPLMYSQPLKVVLGVPASANAVG